MTLLLVYAVNELHQSQLVAFAMINEDLNSEIICASYQYFWQNFGFYMGKAPGVLMMARHETAVQSRDWIYRGACKVFGRQFGPNSSPIHGDSAVLFCPYSLQEELADRFEFLRHDEVFLYEIIKNLPFESEKDELDQNMRELLRLDFKHVDTPKELLNRISNLRP